MKLAIDAHYHGETGTVAGVLFTTWQSCEAKEEIKTQILDVALYETGEFYKRELPGILKLLQQINPLPSYIVIDGYVHLGHDEKPGLGQHLYDALEQKVAIIGVAKSRYIGTPETAELFRGKSRRPLYVTSAGVDQAEAKGYIAQMCGQSRLPVLLKRVDRLCREST
ncbi:MAG: endonuclease V [Anaerolineae bacterium]|nr:endonuclease V [Anaerolineae bacterium]